jgi:hypothetical protein
MPPEGASGRVVEVRAGLLRNYVNGLELFGLPDPLELLPEMLEKTVQGSRSIIHGDLNLENIMVGPGGMLWLIDFAQTREGHTLFDFAHLGAEVIAHVIAPQVPDPRQYLDLLQGQEIPKLNPLNTLLAELEQISSRCLFNPSYRDEYRLALAISCLGALKYTNLSQHDRHLLYLTAAHLI